MSRKWSILGLFWVAICASAFVRDTRWGMRAFALTWGAAWALCLQCTQWGRWLALHRTWLTVVVGTGVNLLLLVITLPRSLWLHVFEVFALSSIGIIARSLINEFRTDAS